MTLYKWVRDEVGKLSYVERTEFKGTTFTIHYLKQGQPKKKKLPYRTTKDILLKTLNSIKKDIDYADIKKKKLEKLMRPSVAHFPGLNAGETDGKRNEDSARTDS